MVMAPRGNAHGLVEWSRRDPWRERMGEMVERHIRRACDLNDIDIYDLQDVIGEHASVAIDCVFEDFCTVTWEDGSNLSSDYLKRRVGRKQRSTVPISRRFGMLLSAYMRLAMFALEKAFWRATLCAVVIRSE